MKNIFIFILYAGLCAFTYQDNVFRAQQLNYPRVKSAYEEKIIPITKLFNKAEVNFSKSEIFLRVFKEERQLEVWARANKGKFKLVKSYIFCYASGKPGPKRTQGDKQVPEGFYFINDFNPASKYHLSLGISYPNGSDKILGNKSRTGGDIYIHGSCVSVGCLAMNDDQIKQLYIIAMEAHVHGQIRIPIHIFPCKMEENNLNALEKFYKNSTDLENFWMNLKTGYNYFEKTKTLPQINIDANGAYKYN